MSEMTMKAILARFLYDRRGTSAVEYGMICAMIVLAMVTALNRVADENSGIWNTFSSKTNEAISKANGN